MQDITSFLVTLYQKNPITQLLNSIYYPIKKYSTNINIFFHSVATIYDQLYRYFITELQEHFVKLSTNIKNFAEERGIVRINGEDYSMFHNRIINSYNFLRYASTLEGITNIIHQSFNRTTSDGNKLFSVRELYKENWILGSEPLGYSYEIDSNNNAIIETAIPSTIISSNSVAYYFVVDFGKNLLSINEKLYVEELIKQYKPAHVMFHINAFISDEWILGQNEETLGEKTIIGIK